MSTLPPSRLEDGRSDDDAPPSLGTVLDRIEERLGRQARVFESPTAYRAGVADAMAAVRRVLADHGRDAPRLRSTTEARGPLARGS